MWVTIGNGARGSVTRQAVIGLAGLAVIGLSFVPGWIEHLRVVMGEGPRNIGTPLTAWELESFPVLAGAVLVDGLLVLVSILALVRPAAVRTWWSAGLALVAIGLLAGSAWPVGQEGHASSVTLTAGWPLGLAIALNVVMLLAALWPPAPRPALLGASALALLLVAGGAMAGRTLQLNLVEGNGRHWTDGSYTRQAAGGQPTERLTFRNGTFSVDDRWSGRLEASGLVVVLTDDPACPNARGAYRVWSAGGQNIWWQKIVDTCVGGARARDLEAGIWARDG
jgi:hypothetical protein